MTPIRPMLALACLLAFARKGMAQEGSVPPPNPWPPALAAPDDFKLFLPGQDWALSLDMRGLDVVQAATEDSDRLVGASVTLSGGDAGLRISAYLEVTPETESGSACSQESFARDLYRLKPTGPPRATDGLALYTSNEAMPGGTMRHVHAYLDIGDTCAYVHACKPQFRSEDQAAIDALVASIRVKRPFAPTTGDWLPYALLGNCADALPTLEVVERGESGAHALDRETWRAVMSRLAGCRLGAGRHDAAAEGLRSALREDPGSATLHYYLAAALAVELDVAGALGELRLAKEAPAPAGELEDPVVNPAFATLATDATFRAGAAELFGSPPDTPRVERLTVAGEGALALDVPGGWRIRGIDAPTYELHSPRGRDASVLVFTVKPGPRTEGLLNSDAALMKALKSTTPRTFGRRDADGDLEFHGLAGRGNPGACATIARAPRPSGEPPRPGEYDVITHCFVSVGGLRVMAVEMTQTRDAPEIAQVLEMLASARHEPDKKERGR